MTGASPPPPSTLVFTATYSEADNIDEWHKRVRQTLPAVAILVVDDNSPDGTADRLHFLAARDDRLHVVVRPRKLGLGSAHRMAMRYAWENDFDLLVTMDADLSHQPEEIPRLLAALPGKDFVIGTRSGPGTSDYTGFRRFASVGGNSLARLLIPTGLTEYTTSFRVYTRPALGVLLTDGVNDEGYAFFMEVVYRLSAAHLRLAEVPITFVDRVHGKSKIPKNQIFTSGLVLLRLSVHRAASTFRARRGRI